MKAFLLAGLALMMPAVADAQTAAITQSIAGTRLDLQARGEVRVVPDIALINAGVITEAIDAASAMAQNATKMSRVLTALKREGVADKDVQTQSVNLSPQYRYVANRPPVITGYQASNQLNIRFRDVGKSGAILDVLVKEGINQINGPTLTVDKPEAAMDTARMEALKILRQRADTYAAAAGMKVRRIVVLSESVDQGYQPMPMMVKAQASDASAETSIAPGEQAIGVTLNAVFELQ
jgi:uncharacterized protein